MKRRALLSLAAVAALAPAAAQASGGEKKTSGGSSYVQIPPLMGSTNKAGGARGVLSVDCGLDVPDPELRTRAEQSTPRLRAAFVQTIQSYAAGLAPGALPSADYIGQALQRQADVVLGRPGARVLLGSIIVN